MPIFQSVISTAWHETPQLPVAELQICPFRAKRTTSSDNFYEC
jgi:hypothetical protein